MFTIYMKLFARTHRYANEDLQLWLFGATCPLKPVLEAGGSASVYRRKLSWLTVNPRERYTIANRIYNR